MDLYDSRYYRINKLILSFIGLWPYQVGITRQVSLTIGILGVCSFSLPQFIYCTEYRHDLDKLLESMPTCFGAVMCTTKWISVIVKITQFRVLLRRIQDDWMAITDALEMEILQKYAESGRRFTLFYTILAIGPSVCYIMSPIATPILDVIWPMNESRQRTIPHPAEYFVDQEKYYYALLINEHFGYAVILLLVVGCDTIYIVLIEYACGMFAIVGYRLENISFCDEDKATKFEAVGKNSYFHIRRCVQLHIKSTQIADLIGTTFSMFLFFDIGLGMLLHSASCVMITIRSDRPVDVIRYASIAFCQSFRLLFNSLPGQKLMEHSNYILEAAYNSSWYKFPAKTRRLMLFLMMRSHLPCTVSIANFYIINLDSFSAVMKASLSYCTVMASLHETSITE